MPRNRSPHHSKSGVHPVTYAVLFIAVIIGVALIVQLWTTAQERAGHAIQIQSVSFQKTSTIVYVQNTGKGTVTIDTIIIKGERFIVQDTNCTVASQKTTTVREAQTAEITINRAYSEKVHVKVICKDGTSIETDWEP